jgi:hypothetical protein
VYKVFLQCKTQNKLKARNVNSAKMFFKVLPIFLFTTLVVAQEKLGVCPSFAPLSSICATRCLDDLSCPGIQKCCTYGCVTQCMDPVGIVTTVGKDKEKDILMKCSKR